MWDYGEDNRGPLMAEVAIGMAVLCVVAVALRSYTMAKLLKRFVIEDYLAVFTCLLQCGFSAVVVVGVSYGLGAHVENVSVENRHKALIYKWAGQVAYIVVSTLVKFVVGIFLLRLCVNNNWQRITIIVLLCVVGVFNAFYVFVAIFQCQPIPYYWYRYTEDAPVTGKCNGKLLATIPTYFAVLIGLLSDLILALLPVTLIKGAKLDKKTKISVCCVLALGSLASVATVARVPYASQLLSNPDYLYNFTDLAIWSIVECGIAITASSLATLRPLFIQMRFLASAHFTSRYGHSRATSGGLPMQSVNSVTVITSRGRSMKSSKRNTGMTGSTAVSMSRYSRSASQSGNLMSVKEGDPEKGIQVDTEFEMSIVTKESSFDSLDRFEAEVNEVITPGSIRRKPSYDQVQTNTGRKLSLGSRPPPLPLDTRYHANPISVESSATATSPSTGPQIPNSSSPHTRRRPSEGPPPSFHLPTRLHHQSTISEKSNHSGLVRFDSRNTLQGLSAPPRVQAGYSNYSSSPDETPLGSPISMGMSGPGRAGRRPSGSSSTPPLASPASGWRYPFPTQNAIPAIPETPRRGKPRVSAFMVEEEEEGESSGSGFGSHERYDREPHSPVWTRPSPELASVPSPLRSNPPGSPGPSGSWV